MKISQIINCQSQFVTLVGTQVTLTLLTDSYPEETTWTVADENGATVWSGGAYENGQTEYVETTCLAIGCYTLSVMDSYGDGMTYGGVTGNYELVDDVGYSFGTDRSRRRFRFPSGPFILP